jgi:hypothetical protein
MKYVCTRLDVASGRVLEVEDVGVGLLDDIEVVPMYCQYYRQRKLWAKTGGSIQWKGCADKET